MDFREEYFENKLKHFGEEVTLISKQLMLIQDFIVYEFGTSFKGFCESRRGGRYFREGHNSTGGGCDNPSYSSYEQTPCSTSKSTEPTKSGALVHNRRIVSDNMIGNTSVPLGNVSRARVIPMADPMVNSSSNVNVNHGSTCVVTSRRTFIPAALKESLPPRVNPSPRSNFGQNVDYDSPSTRSNDGGGDRERTWIPPDSSKGSEIVSTKDTRAAQQEVHHDESEMSTKESITPSSVISVISNADINNGQQMFVDESEEEDDGFDPLGSTDTPSEMKCEDGEVVFIKCERPESDSMVEEVTFENTVNEDSAHGSISQEGFPYDGNDPEEPCSSQQSFSNHLPDFENSLQIGNSGNTAIIDALNSAKKPQRYRQVKVNTKHLEGLLPSGTKSIKTNQLFAGIPWKSFAQEQSNGEILCTVKDCNRRLSNIHKFRRHFLHHTGIKPYRCDQCPAAYTRNDQLTSHKNSQHGKPQAPQTCSMCSQDFWTDHSYRNHVCISRS